MKLELTRFNTERVIHTLTFFMIAILNFDIYVSFISSFYTLVMLLSFFLKNRPFKKKNSFSKQKLPFLFIFYFSLLLIPDLFIQPYIILFSTIFMFILDIYYTKESDIPYAFFIISIIEITCLYLLIGTHFLFIMWLAALIIIQIFYHSKRKIYSVSIVIIFLTAGISTNTKFGDYIALHFPALDFELPYISAIGSPLSILKLPNKVIFTGQGEVPDKPYFYSNTQSNFIDYIYGETEWSDTDYYKRDNDIINISRHIINGKALLQMGYLFLTYKEANYQQNFYLNKNPFSNDYYRSFLNKKHYLFTQNAASLPEIYSLRQFYLSDVIRHDPEKFMLSFKPQFLKRIAIPVVRKIKVKTPSFVLSYFPANVISIFPENKKFTARKLMQRITTYGKLHEYQILNVTYADSVYVQYRTPFPEDLLLSPSQKDLIAKIAPEIDINDNDNVYQKVNKIHKWFDNNFTYTLKLRYNGHGRTLEDFLLRDRKGHCEYFATATALILRYYDIPSQYATGIIIDHKNNNFSGNKKNGHAWNLYWDGAGWITTDNTVATMDNGRPEWMQNMFDKIQSDFMFNKISFSDIDIKKILSWFNLNIILKITLTPLLIITILYPLLKIYRRKFPKRFLEYKLRKELHVYLKKHPKESHVPWKIWAEETQELYCINKVKEYYKAIYPL